MQIDWDGITRLESLSAAAADERNKLADAAKEYNWQRVVAILSRQKEYVNAHRPGGSSWFAPLHQVANGGAPIEVANDLMALGASRVLQNRRGERPVDVAERRGHKHLIEVLTPIYKHRIPLGVLLRLQAHLHDVIRSRIHVLPNADTLRLPELELLLEFERAEMWFPVPGMYGGFRLSFTHTGVDPVLVSESWCRVVDGSEQRHEITPDGFRRVEHEQAIV